jgi:hypothetical protein
LDIQTRLSDKKKREISDCLNDTLTEGGGATGCGIDTKMELRKISEKYHFLIDQWYCINSLEICIKYNIIK